MSQSPGNPAFRAARLERGWHSQADVATAYAVHAAALGEAGGIDVRQVRRWESARPGWPNKQARRVLSAMFALPLEQLGFTPPPRSTDLDSDTARSGEDPMRRRSFLQGVLAATPLLAPAGGPERLSAALVNARRYADQELVAHLRSSLDEIARADSNTGPRQVLPAATELLSVIDTVARDTNSAVRGELLKCRSPRGRVRGLAAP
ncbi:hypothetical protein ACWGCI_02690 [Streptomyces sp. NPDC054949]